MQYIKAGLIATAILAMSCSDNAADVKDLSGHWLYNPGLCENVLSPSGMFDLHVVDSQIFYGDNPQPLEGNWVQTGPDFKESIDVARIALQECKPLSPNSNPELRIPPLVFQGRYQSLQFIQAGKYIVMLEGDVAYILADFNSVKAMNLPISDESI